MAEAIGDVDFLRRIEDKTLNDQSLARDAHILEDYKESDSEIRQFLSDRCILLTGATGFLGTIILEKLLRTCPEIRAIFVLIRKSPSKDMNQKVNELFNNSVFNILKKQRPNYRRKIFPVEGNIQELGLDLNLEDRHKIQDQVSVIIHAAATVRFDEDLKLAVRINVRGTSELIKLAQGCARLVSFVHISTAYSQSANKEIEEKMYDPPMKPCELIDLIENTADVNLDVIKDKLLGNYANTYVYTKAVAEELLREQACGLPICLFRPSIIIATYREPLRGWSSTLYGPAGILVGAGTGFMHSCYCDADNVADLVPVDMVASATIACAWRTAIDGVSSDGPKVYNYVSEPQAPITWGRFCNISAEHGILTPTIHAMWYYSFSLNKNIFIHWLVTIFMTFIPCIFIDGCAILMGKKPRFIKLCKTLAKMTNTFSFFTMNQWKFRNDNIQELYSKMPIADQQCFNFDLGKLDWERHAETHLIGARVYLLNDPASTLPQARIKWQRLKVAHTIFKSVLIILPLLLVGYLLYNALF